MNNYKKLIFSIVSSSTRMLIGASSAIYMVNHNADLYDIGLMKSIQAILILILGFVIGAISDRFNKKFIHLASIFFSILWLALLYIGGKKNNVEYFYVAEILNSISLALAQNNTNSYLVEVYKKDKPTDDISEAFGKLGKLEFISMSITSLVGGILYTHFEGNLFLYTSIRMVFILFMSKKHTPDLIACKGENKKIFRKQEFLLVFRKFNKFRLNIACYILYGVYFQLIIQYWQILSNEFNFVEDNKYILGVILFFMISVQSLSGFTIEKKIKLNPNTIHFMFMISQVILTISFSLNQIILFIFGIVLSIFYIRYILIDTDAEIHKDLKSSFRAKYDMVLNSILRIITAMALLLFVYFSNKYGADIIIHIGLIIPILLFTAILNNKLG